MHVLTSSRDAAQLNPRRSAWLQRRQSGVYNRSRVLGSFRATLSPPLVSDASRWDLPPEGAHKGTGMLCEPVDQLADFGQPRAKVGVAEFDRHQ